MAQFMASLLAVLGSLEIRVRNIGGWFDPEFCNVV